MLRKLNDEVQYDYLHSPAHITQTMRPTDRGFLASDTKFKMTVQEVQAFATHMQRPKTPSFLASETKMFLGACLCFVHNQLSRPSSARSAPVTSPLGLLDPAIAAHTLLFQLRFSFLSDESCVLFVFPAENIRMVDVSSATDAEYWLARAVPTDLPIVMPTVTTDTT